MCDPPQPSPELGSARRELRGTGWDSGRGNEDIVIVWCVSSMQSTGQNKI